MFRYHDLLGRSVDVLFRRPTVDLRVAATGVVERGHKPAGANAVVL